MAPTTCGCEERLAAVTDGWFLHSSDLDGWIFTDGPMRRMTPRAAYQAGEQGMTNHTGEPITWVSCPFCGLDLPVSQQADDKWRSDSTGGDGPE